MMDIRLIWAQGNGGVIGIDNKLPFHVPEDLKHFKTKTLSHPVIMGRNTWYSLPVRPLPNRDNIVLTDVDSYENGGCRWVHSVKESLEEACKYSRGTVYVMGGAQVYKQFMPLADYLDVTEVDIDVPEGNVFAPIINKSMWNEISSTDWLESTSGLYYKFKQFIRKH